MKVVLRNPRREVEVAGNRRVKDVLRDLDILPETVLVIRGDDLVTPDHVLREDDVIELRRIDQDGVQRRSEPRDELEVLADRALNESGHPRDGGVDVDDARLQDLLAAEREQLMRERRGTIGGVADVFELGPAGVP